MWIIALFSEDDRASSKRIFGALGMTLSMLLITLERTNVLIKDLLYVSAGLLGLSMVDKIASGLNRRRSSFTDESSYLDETQMTDDKQV